ncbi:MAG: flagellar hook-basal body complex protein FliE [Opitutae bacterium]|nr:flagellar hook-basal body complex protein FliE [Opitutae bacterium]MBT5716710.1 flagellar hook-basal body complex protein FliE [Opitutae bacterium]
MVNEISSLPSLSDLLTQNPNLQANKQLDRFAKVNEMGQNFGASKTQQTNGVDFVPIDKTTPTERVTAPGFAQMFENFVKGVDQKKKISARETQDLILGRSDNVHEAVVKSQEAGVAFNLMIEVRNKLVESYKELMRMQV